MRRYRTPGGVDRTSGTWLDEACRGAATDVEVTAPTAPARRPDPTASAAALHPAAGTIAKPAPRPAAAAEVVLAPDRGSWAARIRERWQTSVEAILDVGRLLAESKAALAHGEFTKMIESELPFGERTAQTLMQIAAHPVLANPQHAALLPPSWTTLAELARVKPALLTRAIGAGLVRPDMTRKDTRKVVGRPAQRRPRSSVWTRRVPPEVEREVEAEVAAADCVTAVEPEPGVEAPVEAEPDFEPHRGEEGIEELLHALQTLASASVGFAPYTFLELVPEADRCRVARALDQATDWLDAVHRQARSLPEWRRALAESRL